MQQPPYSIQQQSVPTQINAPSPMQNPRLQLLPTQNPPRPTQLLVQPVANPNNKTTQAAYNIDL
jgi:hypothetical protein